MDADRDDEALSWGAETDPTHVDASAPDAPEHPDAPELPGTGSAMLVVYGIFGGIYLLFTVGWLITALRTSSDTGVALNDIMSRISSILAVFAAPAWFVAGLVLTAGRRSWLRILVLVVGIVLLLPWAFVSGSV